MKIGVLPFRIGEDAARMDEALASFIGNASVTEISDCVGPMYTLDGGVRPFCTSDKQVYGSALTVKCPPGDNVAVFKAISLGRPGDILVVDAKGFNNWCLGGFEMLEYAVNQLGIRAFIVNGAYRDIVEIREAGLPLFATGISPLAGPKGGGGEVNVPVCCGGVVIHPGDLVVASDEGVVVVPRSSGELVKEALINKQERRKKLSLESSESFIERFIKDQSKKIEVIISDIKP